MVWPGIFLPESTFSADSLSYSVCTAPVYSCIHQHMCAHYKSQTVAATPLDMEILHTRIGMGSAALVVVVPLPR